MATAVPSRFAVLSMEDDDYKPKKTQKTMVKQSNGKNKNDKASSAPGKQQKKDEKKKQSKGKKNKNNEDRQWEQWKQKDSMAVEETYEQELHQAILLSKLAFEAQGDVKGKDDAEKKKDPNSKKPKKATMSLEEFNNLGTAPVENSESGLESGDCKPKESDVEFFDRIKKETVNEISREKAKDTLKARQNQIDEDITSAQLRVELENRDELVGQLRDEVQTLKDELRGVKKRNKKLYEILSQGEMKDKASVLVEVAKLQEIRDELTTEVASLHALLEQERSKTRASSADPKTTKQTNKKRPASENA